ncbi:type II toxin-antitoxin system RelE/ParE family toxin [Sphingobacterium griseoflavum]|uniref:Toxin n=1 Tax=Sphingobacterium griseoflavum TaxID=1474952 RepID=A0ABQ3HUY2_9SPHI|nr:type II toxin-antitoxin system RelE/ParE family toxin [Sphingobacterium griseoflavum]GHE36129.1 plasmid stabilization protein ParE [Sphingobacterium griseoflavum]
MAKYVLTNKAVEDLSRIWDYTYEMWSENQADKYYELIISTFVEIAENPDLGKSYEKISKKILGFKVGRHIVFYRTLAVKEVEIVRVLHARMDLKNRLRE